LRCSTPGEPSQIAAGYPDSKEKLAAIHEIVPFKKRGFGSNQEDAWRQAAT
jgi:hypothetical protein